MPSIGQVNSSKHYLGHQHDSKPVTASDKVMSRRHLRHRAEVDRMPDKTSAQKLAKEKKSATYNAPHAIEHVEPLATKSTKKQAKAVVKAIKKLQKAKLKELLKIKVKE